MPLSLLLRVMARFSGPLSMAFRSMAPLPNSLRKLLYLSVLLIWWLGQQAVAHDKHYAITQEQRQWFDKLQSKKGPCCANADGNVVMDADWEFKDGHYRVRLEGKCL